MASLVLGAAGAAVGSQFGAAAIGWAIGSALGNFLFQPDLPEITGPRITDLKAQNSAYGNMLPIVYGISRIAGNVIWMGPLREVKTTTEEDSGGKGGGPSQKTTTYSYYVSFAVSLCEGPIVGIGKIWADSELIYSLDVSNSTPEMIFASNKQIKNIKFYPGSETQLPDPTMEAHQGAGNVPGYRGQAYVVITDYDVTDTQGRIPNFTFEVVGSSSLGLVSGPPEDSVLLPATNAYQDSAIISGNPDMSDDGVHYIHHTIREANGGIGDGGIETTPLCSFVRTTHSFVLGKNTGNQVYKIEFPVDTGDSLSSPGDGFIGNWSKAQQINYHISQCRGSGNWHVCALVRGLVGPYSSSLFYLDFDTESYKEFKVDWLSDAKAGDTAGSHLYLPGTYAAKYGDHLYVQAAADPDNPFYLSFAIFYINLDTTEMLKLKAPEDMGKYPDFDQRLTVLATATGLQVLIYTVNESFEIASVRIITYVHGEDTPVSDTGNITTPLILADLPSFWVDQDFWIIRLNNYLLKIDSDLTLTVISTALPDVLTPALEGDIGLGYLDYIASIHNAYAHGVIATVYTENLVGSNAFFQTSFNLGFVPHAYGIVPGSDWGTTLPELVALLCLRTGMLPGEFDVTGLNPTTVSGYVISNKARARELIEILSRIYQFEAVESSINVKFVSRGAASQLTLESRDILIGEDNG